MTILSPTDVLVVDDDDLIREVVGEVLSTSGYRVATAAGGVEALAHLEGNTPAVVVCDVNMPDMNGFDLLERLRSTTDGQSVPFLFLTARGSTGDVVRGLELGADDYLVKPFEIDELLARVRAKVERPPVPAALYPVDRGTGVLSRARFLEEAAREHQRAGRSGREGGVAAVQLVEASSIRDRFGRGAVDVVMRQVADVLLAAGDGLDLAGREGDDTLLVLLPERAGDDIGALLQQAAERVAGTAFVVEGAPIAVTPISGWSTFSDAPSGEDAVAHASMAVRIAATHLDLVPVRWEPHFDREVDAPRAPSRLRELAELARLPFQIVSTFLAMGAVPFFGYWWLDEVGLDITPYMYVVVVVALLVTATAIWTEGLLALRQLHPPEEPRQPYPPASAVIAAYLPNEAATVMETVEAFLSTDHPADVQIILAYNTPLDMPIEERFRELAASDPRFVPFRVPGSTSKAQNVNAALSMVTGDFVGIFDADHMPEPDGFRRAWRWLADGWDVVQGHPVVRNGDVS